MSLIPYDIKRCFISPMPLLLKWHGPDDWELGARTTYSWTWKDTDEEVEVPIPAGYRCDGASIPQLVRNVVDAIEILPAAFLHDPIYESHGGDRLIKVGKKKFQLINTKTNRPLYITRREADALLAAFSIAVHADASDAILAFLATRVGGRGAWEDEE